MVEKQYTACTYCACIHKREVIVATEKQLKFTLFTMVE